MTRKTKSVLVIVLLFVVGCGEPKQFVFEPCTTYGDGYLTAMSQYICMLYGWVKEGDPPPPQAPSQMHTGSYPTPNFQTPFMQGYGGGYAAGMQAGAINLQAARNHAYNLALQQYYNSLGSSENYEE
jgi:hypothetical protein